MIYKHRIPVQQTSTSNVHDPCTFVIDVFNLIDNALVDELAAKKEKIRKANESKMSQNVTNSSQQPNKQLNKKSTGDMSAKGSAKGAG